MHPLKHLLLVGAGLASFSLAAQPEKNLARPAMHLTEKQDVTPVTAQFDYAFGDHIAGAMKLPGASGANWNLGETLDGIKGFCKKHPGALSGRNVLVIVCYSKSIMNIFNATALRDTLLKEVGPQGRIVIMGVSEIRAGNAAKSTNDNIRKLAARHPDVMIYGGPVLDAAPQGASGGKQADKIYPTTADEIQNVARKAKAALNKSLGNDKTKQPPAHNGR